MPKVKIDKKALKKNELEIIIYDLIEFVKTNPRKVLIPVGIVVLVAVISYFTINYFKEQTQNADLQLLQAQTQFKMALNSTDKSSQIVGLNRCVETFKKVAEDNSYSKIGKISAVYVGDCYFHLGRYDDAIKEYKSAIDRGAPPLTSAWAQMSIGYSYQNKTDYKSAVENFDKLVKDYPDSFLVPIAKLQTGICYEKLNDFTKAKAVYERLVRTHPESMVKSEAEARLSAIGGSVAKPLPG